MNDKHDQFNLNDYAALPTVQLSSVCAVEKGDSCKLKMRSPWADTYVVSFPRREVARVEFYNESGKLLIRESESFELTLGEGEIVYCNILPVRDKVRMAVEAKHNKLPLPFSIGKAPDPASFALTSGPADPLRPANISYQKRENTLYVYCNAPEEIKCAPQVVNTCITRQDISNQSVFFTFEQQTTGLDTVEGFESSGVYYGYRVTNTGEEDLFITVRNIGWQIEGKGTFLGEREWIDFYNTRFPLPDMRDFTDSQMRLYEGYYGFSGKYSVHSFRPTTYRIPKGKYMYVMGGTTRDAFGGFSVANTANKLSTNSPCANGAVLFEVVGKAEGAYYVYNDIGKVAPGGEGYDTHTGMNDPAAYGVVHTGEDVGYVVDNQATWAFNDATPSQTLPVTFTNYYSETCQPTGKPNTPIPGTKPHVQTATEWVTHIDPQCTHEQGPREAIGTDMTTFHTVNREGKPIVVGANYYDSRGEYPNIGNWMKDYQDVFTFVNQGDKAREITVRLICTGAVVMMVRDMQGRRIKGSAGYSMVHGPADLYGTQEEGFDKSFCYRVKIPAHSVKQFVVEYNLMANSTGYVRHSVDLK